jgi:formate--tetrahydrofolate ligase
VTGFPTDLEIAHQARLLPLSDVAADIGLPTSFLEPYGENVAKVKLDAIEALAQRPRARYVVVSAKTHLSISSDPQLKGAPRGWVLPVREVRASVGAGVIYPICGDMRTMPGLASHPAAERIDIDEDGEVVGLS